MTTNRRIVLAAALLVTVLAACVPRALPLPQPTDFNASREQVHSVIVDYLVQNGWVVTQSDVTGGLIAAEKSQQVYRGLGLFTGRNPDAVQTQVISVVTSAPTAGITRVAIQGRATQIDDFNKIVAPAADAIMVELIAAFGPPQ